MQSKGPFFQLQTLNDYVLRCHKNINMLEWKDWSLGMIGSNKDEDIF